MIRQHFCTVMGHNVDNETCDEFNMSEWCQVQCTLILDPNQTPLTITISNPVLNGRTMSKRGAGK